MRSFRPTITGIDASIICRGILARAKKSFDVSRFPRQARVVLRALKRYGMIVADNGSDWFISGAPHDEWDNDQLRALKSVKGKHFVVVDTAKPRGPDFAFRP